MPNISSPPRADRSRPVLPVTAIILLAAFGAAWGYFITAFGWSGALLGWWPGAVIGGGGALAILQAVELCSRRLRTRRADPRSALRAAPDP